MLDIKLFIIFYLINIMDIFTQLFWLSFLLFVVLSAYLLCCTKRTNIFYVQIASGLGMFATSKIGRKFLGLE
jgi:hypothetical protein